MAESIPVVEQKETIKLMRMSKGYQWEIKLIVQEFEPKSQSEADKAAIARLRGMDNDLRRIYIEGGDEDD